MNLDNSNVKFRRGTKDSLPDTVTDGYISLDINEGQMYADIKTENNTLKRVAVNGHLFGVSDTDEYTLTKYVEIPGVPSYFDGLTVTVVFNYIDKQNVENLSLSVSGLEYIPLMADETTSLSGVDIEQGVPYTFVYRLNGDALGGKFVLNQSNVNARPKWKHLSDRN